MKVTILTRGILSVLVAGSLSACSFNFPAAYSALLNRDNPAAISPVQGGASPFLERARTAFKAGHYGLAIFNLERELSLRPGSIAALNGLGASYDQLGRYTVAQGYYFRALDLAPTAPVTLANLGYSYLLQGRPQDAVALFELALEYDPGSEQAGDNLREAQRRLQMALQLQPAVQPEEKEQEHAAHLMRSSLPEPGSIQVQEENNKLPVFSNGLRLEVSNGNGVNGMAASVRTYLRSKGAGGMRLTNADTFEHARSVVYYRKGYRQAAEHLLEALPVQTLDLQETDALPDAVDVRLLIGRDFPKPSMTSTS